ncbi:hypothetical protein RKD28_003408 [Streptomyces sp. SAI-229]
MCAEPVDPGAEQVVEQGRDDERDGRERYRHEARAQRQPAQRVHVVGQRAHGRALRGRGGQQGGRGALPAHRPEPLGDSGHEGGDEEHGRRVLGRPVDPQRRHDEQRGPQAVRADHGPAAVQRSVLRGERRERAEEYGAEQQRRQDAYPENDRHCERHAPVAPAEGPLGDRRLQDQENQDQEGEDVADPAHELRAPQPFQLGSAQQGADGTLAGVRDEGVVGGRLWGRWLLGSRHAFSLSARADSSARRA